MRKVILKCPIFKVPLLKSLSQKLKPGYRHETQYLKPVFTNRIRQYCKYQYFLENIILQVYVLSLFNFLIQIYTNVKNPKRKLGSSVHTIFSVEVNISTY